MTVQITQNIRYKSFPLNRTAMNKFLIYSIICVLAVIATSCGNDRDVDISCKKTTILMEIYDTDGNNLLDDKTENNIVGTDIKYVRKDQGIQYPVSWTGEPMPLPSGSKLWDQVRYIKGEHRNGVRYCRLQFIERDYSDNFIVYYDLLFDKDEQPYNITIHHTGDNNQTKVYINNTEVPVSGLENNPYAPYQHIFKLAIPPVRY